MRDRQCGGGQARGAVDPKVRKGFRIGNRGSDPSQVLRRCSDDVNIGRERLVKSRNKMNLAQA